MDLALNNLQRLICHKTQTSKQKLLIEHVVNSNYSGPVSGVYNISWLMGKISPSPDEGVLAVALTYIWW